MMLSMQSSPFPKERKSIQPVPFNMKIVVQIIVQPSQEYHFGDNEAGHSPADLPKIG